MGEAVTLPNAERHLERQTGYAGGTCSPLGSLGSARLVGPQSRTSAKFVHARIKQVPGIPKIEQIKNKFYIEHSYIKRFAVVYLKFTSNWAACILSGNLTPGANVSFKATLDCLERPEILVVQFLGAQVGDRRS